MHKLNLVIGLFSMTFMMAQDANTFQKEIDYHLWMPFKAAFENSDGSALNFLYAEQVLRVTPNGIDTENRFKAANLKRFEQNKANNTSVHLDFWFDSRKTNDNTSYEVGFYRLQLTNAEGVDAVYGQFHIVLQKLDGAWKIVQDWDTDTINGERITAEDFEKQKPLKFE